MKLSKPQREVLMLLGRTFALFCKGGEFRAAESLVSKGLAERRRYGDWSGGYYIRTPAGDAAVQTFTLEGT